MLLSSVSNSVKKNVPYLQLVNKKILNLQVETGTSFGQELKLYT